MDKIQSSVIQTPRVHLLPLPPDPDYPMDSYRISKAHEVSPMGCIISIGNLRLLKHASVVEK
ncbi:MAG: hypothetical protein A2026_03735 [Deltaproteobacteria bacterium RBG_19FT_COMBO_46_12]|nr:MAG: hypothetical protein A2026_03735 [Deltaproteobacteria bacterium RBG_19FT_COMBO_46_12]